MSSDVQQSKRKRKSGWDITPSNQSQQEILLQQQISLQKAQQLILQKTGVNVNVRPATSVLSSNPVSIIENRIYVGALNYDLGEREVRNMFTKFGTITRMDMSHDGATMRSKGYCFIEYSSKEEADAAIKAMNGYEVLGRKIKVNRPSPGALPITPSTNNISTLSQNHQATFATPSSVSSSESKYIIIQNVRIEFSIDDVKAVFASFGNIININTLNKGNSPTQTLAIEFHSTAAASEAATCMNGFDFGGTPLKVELSTINPFNAQLSIEKTVVQLENMITIHDLTDPSLKDEILQEANKFGDCKDILFVKFSNEAHVKLVYGNHVDANQAVNALNGRLFAGNSIKAYLVKE